MSLHPSASDTQEAKNEGIASCAFLAQHPLNGIAGTITKPLWLFLFK